MNEMGNVFFAVPGGLFQMKLVAQTLYRSSLNSSSVGLSDGEGCLCCNGLGRVHHFSLLVKRLARRTSKYVDGHTLHYLLRFEAFVSPRFRRTSVHITSAATTAVPTDAWSTLHHDVPKRDENSSHYTSYGFTAYTKR